VCRGYTISTDNTNNTKKGGMAVRSLDVNRQVSHAAIGIGSMRALAPNFRIGGIKGIRGRVRGSVSSSADTRIYSKSGAGGRGGPETFYVNSLFLSPVGESGKATQSASPSRCALAAPSCAH